MTLQQLVRLGIIGFDDEGFVIKKSGGRGMSEEFMLEGQKLTADTITVPLTKEDLELLITGLSYVSTNDQVVNLYQKLTKKLETLEKQNDS